MNTEPSDRAVQAGIDALNRYMRQDTIVGDHTAAVLRRAVLAVWRAMVAADTEGTQ